LAVQLAMHGNKLNCNNVAPPLAVNSLKVMATKVIDTETYHRMGSSASLLYKPMFKV